MNLCQNKYKIAFAATSAFACPFFQELQKLFDIKFLMTKKPDQKSKNPSFGKFIQEQKIDLPCYYPNNMKEIDDYIFEDLDAMIVIAYGYKIPKRFLDKCPWINLHGSLLPKFRGAAPINYSIIEGDNTTGLSSTIMVEQIDSGPIIDLLEVNIDQDDTALMLAKRMQESGKQWFAQSVFQYLKGEKIPVQQDHSLATFAPSITSATKTLDWNKPAHQLHNRIRGLSPNYCCSITIDNIRLKLVMSEVISDLDLFYDSEHIIGQLIAPRQIGKLIMCCGEGFIRLKSVIPESSKEMSDENFIRGYRGEFLIR